jgi:DNA-binding NtrC family response regulator
MFEKQTILIVEDECFVALDLASAVEDWDGRVIGPAATVAHALELMESAPIAAAILDAQLADRDVTPVAMALAERGVPFVIHTGTGLPAEIEKVMPDVPVVMKPVRPPVVLACLLNEIRQPRAQRLLQ